VKIATFAKPENVRHNGLNKRRLTIKRI